MPPGCPPEELTSVMWRNIPNRYTYEMLVQVMNEHGFEYGNNREYHSVYLPWDDYNKCNRGYAFINLTSRPVADRFMTIFNGYQWPRNTTRSSKTSCVTWATTQVKHFSFDDSPGHDGQPDGYITDGRFRASSHCSTVVTDGTDTGRKADVPQDSPIHMVTNMTNYVDPPPENTVFVGGLSPAINTADLKALMSRQFGPVIDCEVKRCRSTGKSRCFGFCSFESSSSAVAAVDASNSALQGNLSAGGLLRHLGSSARVKHYEQVPRRSYLSMIDASNNNGILNNGNTDVHECYTRRVAVDCSTTGNVRTASPTTITSVPTSIGSSPTLFSSAPGGAIEEVNGGFESLLGDNSRYTDELNLDCLRNVGEEEQKRYGLPRASAYTSGGCYYLYAKDMVDDDNSNASEDLYQPWVPDDTYTTSEQRITTDPGCAQQ
ncbi:glycine-rich RNA-binding protein, putative [Perkinsus marinus ATCC 50983]|uniref:Glycine-rich RNA-binding protein, putative n=1 Tax=Perkinsus marinus (strain ATCC 50983 / TXsc) TaxID=423536 RepID=C5KJB8_PERM5|nr:glycine-rich RNA-binding protein, putative [Perkinsus marinus ATCC 50983]EER15420.1 glycine-rich RNA-binding protein, putative [Perkinsus marinus ATCC 50983]|eukprot:XP_002783624.1 glycine-rich RNA-binding protein, putative [Perkinsus marinus ATCC 50983]